VSAPLAFIDTETTGLDSERHQIWEVGAIVDDIEYHWFLNVDLARADPMALAIGRFHDRHPNGYTAPATHTSKQCTHPHTFAHDFARLTAGRHLVGAVVSFDEERLRKLLLSQGFIPAWHYHLVDVEALAAGWLMAIRSDAADMGIHYGGGGDAETEHATNADVASPPWKSSDLAEAVGVKCDQFDQHTALGDARWAKAIYEAVMGK
jgi:hypothetical protein